MSGHAAVGARPERNGTFSLKMHPTLRRCLKLHPTLGICGENVPYFKEFRPPTSILQSGTPPHDNICECPHPGRLNYKIDPYMKKYTRGNMIFIIVITDATAPWHQ